MTPQEYNTVISHLSCISHVDKIILNKYYTKNTSKSGKLYRWEKPPITTVRSYGDTTELSNVRVVRNHIGVTFSSDSIVASVVRAVLKCLSFGPDDGIIKGAICISVLDIFCFRCYAVLIDNWRA